MERLSRVREGGEATRCFCIVGTVVCWLLSLLLILSFVALICQTFSKTNSSLITEVSTSLFVHNLHLQALVNVNIAFEFFRVSIQSKAVRSTTDDFSLRCCWQLVEN